jgi:opacity protein-like surface antigen
VKISARAATFGLVITSALTVAHPLRAQDSPDGFRFQRPSGSWSLRGGFAMPNANSDIFSYTTNNFTVSRGDFGAFDYGADLAFSLTDRLDLVFDVSYSGMNKSSEYRSFVDNNQQPIQQTTGFQRTPVTVNARYYLTDRGRQVGHYAWIPRRVVPYVGAGVGAMYYEFDQKGDFIDNSTLAVNSDDLHSGGWAPMAQGLAGVEWSLTPGWAFKTEARYLIASTNSSGDYSGYRVDLSGLTSSVGFIVRF